MSRTIKAEMAVRPAASSESTGSTLLAGVPRTRAVFCNTTGTYWLYLDEDATYQAVNLVSGMMYPFCVTKITAVGGGATVSGSVIALW